MGLPSLACPSVSVSRMDSSFLRASRTLTLLLSPAGLASLASSPLAASRRRSASPPRGSHLLSACRLPPRRSGAGARRLGKRSPEPAPPHLRAVGCTGTLSRLRPTWRIHRRAGIRRRGRATAAGYGAASPPRLAASRPHLLSARHLHVGAAPPQRVDPGPATPAGATVAGSGSTSPPRRQYAMHLRGAVSACWAKHNDVGDCRGMA